MSSKQISRAAMDRTRLRFRLNVNIDPIVGYVVGMDDYHWLVANQEAHVMLVHKGSTVTVEFTEQTLDNEPLDMQSRIAKIGQPFWDACTRQQRGHNNMEESA
jgi:hypothetical protein